MSSSPILSADALALRDKLQAQRNWQDTYRVLIEAARQQQPLAPELCNEAHRVQGCEAKVWLHVQGTSSALQYQFASESRMVSALTYAALLPLQGQSASVATHFNVEQWLKDCNLIKHLAPSRSNGLYQIIRRARHSAARFC